MPSPFDRAPDRDSYLDSNRTMVANRLGIYREPHLELEDNFDIDLSLFGHIHLDPFLSGTFNLEGNRFQRTVRYLQRYLTHYYSTETSDILELLTRVQGLSELEKRIIDTNRYARIEEKTKGQRELGSLTAELSYQLLKALPVGEYLSLPGGWDGKDGHAMIYQFQRVSTGLKFYIHNAGAGIQYHARQSAKDRELFSPVQVYHIPNPIDEKKLNEFLRNLILPRMIELRDQKDKMFDEKRLYEEVIPSIHFLGGQLDPHQKTPDHVSTAGQLSGTCAQRVLHQMMKRHFKTLAEYQRFIYGFKRYALEDYLRVLKAKGLQGDQRVHGLIQHAIDTMLRTLDLSGVFEATFVDNERSWLASCRAELVPILFEREEEVAVETPPISTAFELKNTPPPLIPRAQELMAIAELGEPGAIITVHGGAHLLEELRDVIIQCEQLKSLEQHSIIFERLELLFTSFPLPEKDCFAVKMPFYSAINASNQDDFYELIQALETYYLDAFKLLNQQDQALPRRLVAGLSIVTVLDYVTNQFLLYRPDTPASHDIFSVLMMTFFQYRRNNPFFATYHPVLDDRLKAIQTLYPTHTNTMAHHLIRYYYGIVDSEPELKSILIERYKSSERDYYLARDLDSSSGSIKALYHLTEHFDDLSQEAHFSPLIKKFNRQRMIEELILHAIPVNGLAEIDLDQKIKIVSNRGIMASSVLSQLLLVSNKISVSTGRDDLAQPVNLALSLITDEFQTPHVRKRTDNHIQLYPSSAAYTLAWMMYTLTTTSTPARITERRIDLEIADREFFHLRTSITNQIKCTLDYFQREMPRLSDRSCQIYMEANLFEPGLLAIELDNHPNFLEKMDVFIHKGLSDFSDRGFTSQNSLFFIRLAYLVNRFAAEHHPQRFSERLDTLQQLITNLLQNDDGNDVSIQHSLHQYQFLTAMSRLKLKRTLDKDEILAIALPSYLYFNAHHNPEALVDLATRFDLETIKHDFMLFMQGADQKKILRLIGLALPSLGLGDLVDGPIRHANSLYHVTMRQGEYDSIYYVDALRALVFNSSGMANSPVPLQIINHPVTHFLHLKHFVPCFASSDRLCFEVGSPIIRFLRAGKDLPFRIQKQWTVNGHTEWYELNTLSQQMKAVLNAGTSSYDFIDIPETVKQRDNLLWVNCEAEKTFLITENDQPIYFYSHERTNQEIKQLDKTAHVTDLSLCLGTTWLHSTFAHFEDPKYLSVLQKDDDHFEVVFDRYGFTLLATNIAGQWVYRLKDEPSYQLEFNRDARISGAAELVFKSPKSNQRICYLPIQQFSADAKAKASERSEYYKLHHDTSLNIARRVLQKNNSFPKFPWQYTRTEKIIRYDVNEKSELISETPCDALYLCYVYLACGQPEKAWAVLDDCAKRLGGLKGTIEELERIHWIINALPRTLDQEDSKAVIRTPRFVACQLKALALLTSAVTPGKTIRFPPQTLDVTTPNGCYKEQCWKDLLEFHTRLNETIYSTYSRFQSMQRSMEHGFVLEDSEKKSLLDFYHFHLPGDEPKALGALGYEWYILGLKSLKKQQVALSALALKGRLPLGYQKRLEDIDAFLKQNIKVRQHHSELALRRLDLSITDGVKVTPTAFYAKAEDPTTSWMDNIDLCPLASIDELQRALVPKISEQQLCLYFTHYYRLLLKTSVDGPDKTLQKQLIDFCRQYLMAHRFVPLDKQENKVAYLCNILLRVAENPSAARVAAKKLGDIMKHCQDLSDPVIEIYQLLDTTDKFLAETRGMWAALDREVLPPGKRMIADPYDLDVEYGFEQFISSFPNEAQWRQFGEAYRQQATMFGQPPSVDVEEERGVSVLSPGEKRAGDEQVKALHEMKRIADSMLSDFTVREQLEEKADAFMAAIEIKRTAQLANLLALANLGPEDLVKKRHRDLELDGHVRAHLDEPRLLALYYGADEAQYALETGLNAEQIQTLHTSISHYVALSTRQKALERLKNQLLAARHSADTTLLQQIAHELLTVDGVDHQHDPALAVLQYQHNLLLRPQQISAINELLTPNSDPLSYQEDIKKIIMGGGKSKVILPAVAKKKATGTNLVVIEVPRALFETNCADLSDASGQLYHQKAIPFEFNRESDCSAKSLAFIYSKLNDVISDRNYLVTTGDAIQSLELKYLELVLQRPEESQRDKEWSEQVAWLDKIVSLFRSRADVVMDEVHQALLLKKKLNYTLGEHLAVPKNIIDACVALYGFLDYVPLDALGHGFSGKTLSSFLEDHKAMMELMTDDSKWSGAMARLMTALIDHPSSPLRLSIDSMSLSGSQRSDLIKYLANQGQEVPDYLCQCKDAAIFALYKEQASELLSQTLKRILNVNYGASHQRPDEGIAIPYECNKKPLERSRFGNFLEAMNFTIQMVVMEGVHPEQMKRYLSQLQVMARQEWIEARTLRSIDQTNTGRAFQILAPGMRLSELRLTDDAHFAQIYQRLQRNKALLFEVLKTDVLPQIQLDSEILHSDSFNHVDCYRSVQGVTGTPSNSSTYHQRLSYKKHTAAATDGFILGLLKEKNTQSRAIKKTTTPAELIEQLFLGKSAGESVRAIIDICALFRGISNFEVVKALASHVRKNRNLFSHPSELKYILFFNEENRLTALGIDEGSKPIVIGSTDPEVINAKLGCTPKARFNYYDQEHTLGVDLKLAPGAKGLALVDQETTLEKAFQGFLRERQFQDDQSIEIIVPESMNILSLDGLISLFAENEEQQLQKDNFFAALAKMTNMIRADFMRRLLELPDNDVDKKHRYAMGFKSYFVEQANHDLFKLYGDLTRMLPTKKILETHRDRLLKDWSETLQRLDLAGDTSNLLDHLNGIISNALPVCHQAYLSPTRQDRGTEVVVEKQVEKEMQLELHREEQRLEEVFDAHKLPQQYISWSNRYFFSICNDFDSLELGLQKLTALCRKELMGAPDFGEISVGMNYYQSYNGQTKFLDLFLKPVHVIMFHKRSNGVLECLLLSQQEAEELSHILNSKQIPDLWLSTTQHTVLAGHPPVDIIKNPDYQQLIEKIRFFNGEYNLLLNKTEPLHWLREDTENKLSFFEQHLMRIRKTDPEKILLLREALSPTKPETVESGPEDVSPPSSQTVPETTEPSSSKDFRLAQRQSQALQKARVDFYAKLQRLEKKVMDLTHRNQFEAADVVTLLCIQLREASDKFFISPTAHDLVAFKENCGGILNQHRSVLETHRGINVDLLFSIITLGLYAIAAAIHSAVNHRRFGFFPTESAKLADDVEDSINHLLKPTASQE